MQIAQTWQQCGARVRELRQAGGISQRELADAALISQASLSRMESGAQEPAALAFMRVCAHLSVPAEVLLGEDQGAFTQALRVAAARRLAIGCDERGRAVGVRRDRAMPGGPHSVFAGARALGLAQREVMQRSASGLRSVVLARDVRWRDARLLGALGAALRPVSDVMAAGSPGTTVAAVSAARSDGAAATEALAALMSEGDLLVVVDERMLVDHSDAAEMTEALFRHGRRTGCAVNLVCENDAPAWALANAAQTVAATDAGVTLSVRDGQCGYLRATYATTGSHSAP